MVDINNNKKGNNNTSKQVLLSVLGVAILIVAVVGISFAAFTYTKTGEQENTISTGTVTMAYNEPENGITIENAIPMTTEQGKVLNGDNEKFDFNVSATITGKTTINYEVVAKKGEGCTIPDEYIRLYLEQSDDKDGSYTEVFAPAKFTGTSVASEYGAEAGTMQLATGSFTNNNDNGSEVQITKYYRLRMWVDKDYVLSDTSKTYKVTVNVYGKGKD